MLTLHRHFAGVVTRVLSPDKPPFDMVATGVPSSSWVRVLLAVSLLYSETDISLRDY